MPRFDREVFEEGCGGENTDPGDIETSLDEENSWIMTCDVYLSCAVISSFYVYN